MPSAAIRRYSYDEVTRTLFVTFVDGDTYAYFDAPQRLYDDFRAATSKGGFFARRVRDKYSYQRLDAPEEPSLFPGSDDPASPPPAGARR
jgi:cellulose synthase/poly-beta-1,6-N-acetylglucosamine synthase-like glycosyltransferase